MSSFFGFIDAPPWHPPYSGLVRVFWLLYEKTCPGFHERVLGTPHVDDLSNLHDFLFLGREQIIDLFYV